MFLDRDKKWSAKKLKRVINLEKLHLGLLKADHYLKKCKLNQEKCHRDQEKSSTMINKKGASNLKKAQPVKSLTLIIKSVIEI